MSVTIYRAAYLFENGDEARVHFSGWVRDEGRQEIVDELAAVNPPGEGSPGGVEPVLIGWEELVLEDPALD